MEQDSGRAILENINFRNGFEKVAKARWVKEFMKIKSPKKLRDMIHSLTSTPGGVPSDGALRTMRAQINKGNLGNKKKLLDTVKRFSRDPGQVIGRRDNRLKQLGEGRGRIMQELKKDPNIFKKVRPYTKKFKRKATPYEHTDPESYVEITHGGTKQFLNKFKSRKTTGYSLEKPGLGIQVHPGLDKFIDKKSIADRTKYYATSAGEGMGGTPARLTGRIKAKYLQAANNTYEAGLTQANLKHVKDLKIIEI